MQQFLRVAVRGVVDLEPALVPYDIPLVVEVRLVEPGLEMREPLGLQPECELELMCWEAFLVESAVDPRRSVDAASRALDEREVLTFPDVERAPET